MSSWEQRLVNMDTMKTDIEKTYGNKLPGRTRQALINSGYANLALLKSEFESNYGPTVEFFLRSPNVGRVTLDQIVSLLNVSAAPETFAEPVLTGRTAQETPWGTWVIELTKRERQLIRRLIAGFKAVYDDDYESELIDELVALRDKL